MMTLTPSVDEFPGVVRILIDLSDSVLDVATTTDTPQLGLVIPDYLYTRYRRYLELDFESSPPVEPKKRSRK
jgi:hypothetical protein